MDFSQYENILSLLNENFKLNTTNNVKFLSKKNKKFFYLKNKLKNLKKPNINKKSFGEIPLKINIDDLLCTELNLNEFNLIKIMPVKNIDFNLRDKYLIKQKLNLLFKNHISKLFNKNKENYFQFLNEDKEENINIYMNDLENSLNLIENDEYCKYLRVLYHQDLFSLKMINLYYNNEENLQIIIETLETSVENNCYHKTFKNILHTNQISNSTLNDEICLLTTNWTFMKTILNSMRDEIRSFILNLNESNKINNKLFLKSKLNEIELSKKFCLFKDLKKTKKTDYFKNYLNELNFLTIDLTRELILFLIKNKNEEKLENFQTPPVFELFNNKEEPKINLYLDIQLNLPFINTIKTKLQKLINDLYKLELLKKPLLNLNQEPDVDIYLNIIWLNIIKILNSLNNIDQSYLAEIFLANKNHLHNSCSFISRKYVYFIIRKLFEIFYLIISTMYDNFPVKTVDILQKNKKKLDNLIDQAFLIHLKNNTLTMIADADLIIKIKKPNLIKFINQPITRHNVVEILSELISLTKLHLLESKIFSSPLYTEFVELNEKYKNFDDQFEKQMHANLFKNLEFKSEVIKDPTNVIKEIIENEILMQYINLIPKLECLEQVTEFGSQVILGLGMKKKVSFLQNI